MSRFIDKHEIEQLSIVDLLARLGHRHRFKSGPEYFYHSMLRDDDHSPSFSVNDAKGTWMDRGNADPTRRGGGIVQLVAALWPHLSFVDLLNEISSVFEGSHHLPAQSYIPHQKDEPMPADSQYQFELWDVRPIGSYGPIGHYLSSRGLLEVAAGHLSEVYYRNLKRPERELPFFAVGWLNEHGNFEFSTTTGFKSSIGRKGISVIPGDPAHVQVFEGYFDYLSRLRYFPRPDVAPTVIVLNAVNMLVHAIDRLKHVPVVDAFIDRDGPGRECLETLATWVPQTIDRSEEYDGFKDYNAKLQNDLQLNSISPTRRYLNR